PRRALHPRVRRADDGDVGGAEGGAVGLGDLQHAAARSGGGVSRRAQKERRRERVSSRRPVSRRKSALQRRAVMTIISARWLCAVFDTLKIYIWPIRRLSEVLRSDVSWSFCSRDSWKSLTFTQPLASSYSRIFKSAR